MVLMNLFSGKEQIHRCREWTGGHRRATGRVGWMEKVALTFIHYLL